MEECLVLFCIFANWKLTIPTNILSENFSFFIIINFITTKLLLKHETENQMVHYLLDAGNGLFAGYRTAWGQVLSLQFR